MQNVFMALSASLAFFAGPAYANEPAAPLPQKDFSYRPYWEAVGAERTDGSLSIIVILSQRAIVHENGKPVEHLYTMSFEDHKLTGGMLCLTREAELTQCLDLASLTEAQESARKTLGENIQRYFVKMYKDQIEPVVENQLRQQAKPEQVERRPAPPNTA